MSAPIITINNQFDPLNPQNCMVDLLGTLSTNTIKALSGTDLSINGNLSFVQSIPVLSSPNGLRIRVAEIYNTGLVTSFLGDCVFSNVVLFANGIETNTIKQRTGTALALTSPTINISGSTAINLTGPTNCINDATFQQAVRTNFIQSQANTPLIIAALMSDGKTQTNMHLTSPVIQLDNSYGLVNEAAVYISGNLTFNNPVSNPHITGRNLNIYSRTNANPPVNTPLSISSSTCNISQETLNITSSVSNNITGQTNFDKNINVLSNRGSNINPSSILYRTYGSSAFYNINNSAFYTKVTDGQTSKGSKIIPVNGLIVGDIYKLTLRGLLSTSTTGSMEFAVSFGVNIACMFSFVNTAMGTEGFEFSCELNVKDAGSGNIRVDTGLGKLERNNVSTRFFFATPGDIIPNLAAPLDILMKPTANLGTGNVYIYNYTVEYI